MYQPINTRTNTAERGQSLVEFTIGMIVLLIIFSGLVDFGRAYFAYTAIEDAANEGATFLSIRPLCKDAMSDGSDTECDDPNNAFFRSRNASGGDIDWSKTTIKVSQTGFGVGDPVTVTISYKLPLITPFLPPILGTDHIELTAVASHVIITEKQN